MEVQVGARAEVALLTTTTPWETVVGAYLDAAIGSPHTHRPYERHLHHAFAVLAVEPVSEVSGADLARYRAVVSSALARRRSPLGRSRCGYRVGTC